MSGLSGTCGCRANRALRAAGWNRQVLLSPLPKGQNRHSIPCAWVGEALVSDLMTVGVVREAHRGLPEVLSVGQVVSWTSELKGLNCEETPRKAGPFHNP